ADDSIRRVRPTLMATLFAATAFAAAGCSGGDGVSPADGGGGRGVPARMVRVTDGDTIVVTLRGRRERVRLVGIDTPEVAGPYTDEECFGPQASARTQALLAPGDPVRLVRDAAQPERDRHDRLLAYVLRPGEARSVNERLVAEGYARVYVVGRRFTLADRFDAAQRDARAARRGLWGACGTGTPPPPPAPAADRHPCPPGRPVKGNLPSGIYHLPGSRDYTATTPERCFATARDAERAGFRPPRG
ncbi:MAG: thermonuclease family protein, partial [Actinomycetota bacterium]